MIIVAAVARPSNDKNCSKAFDSSLSVENEECGDSNNQECTSNTNTNTSLVLKNDHQQQNDDDNNNKNDTNSNNNDNENNNEQQFRLYNELRSEQRVIEHYRDMRKYHTIDFYKRMEHKYSFLDTNYRAKMTIEEAFHELEHYIDASDPDLDLPNKLHLLQTAEGIRNDGHPDWFQLVGLLHDMGKIMFLWGTAEDGQDGRSSCCGPGSSSSVKQWALGGDTFVLGCQIPDDAVVFPQFNHLNPDMKHDIYKTKYGIYEPNCGLSQLKFCWGHDEYMYRMLIANKCTIPNEGLDMIRYHSAYPLHDKGAYQHLLKPEDNERIKWIQLFNKYDLYTKDDTNDIRDKMETTLWPYYKTLLNKYGLGGILRW